MDWDKHLAYEINELCRDLDRLYESWPGMHGATPTPWERPEAVAYFEALLVHARNLIEFFVVGPVKHENALTPGDFGLGHHNYDAARARFRDGVGWNVEAMYSMICTYVSHLSKERDVELPYWPLQPLVETLTEEADLFTRAAEQIGNALPLTCAAIADAGLVD
jgi:hypothetical protein